MALDVGSIFIYIFGLFVLYILCWFFIKPIKWVLKFSTRCLLGGGVIWIANWVLGGLGFHLGMNLLNAMTVGVLGIPGAIMLVFINSIL